LFDLLRSYFPWVSVSEAAGEKREAADVCGDWGAGVRGGTGTRAELRGNPAGAADAGRLADAAEEIVPAGAADAESSADPDVWVTLRQSPDWVELLWREEGRTLGVRQPIEVRPFPEEAENRLRRVKRLALHRLLTRERGMPPNPWGVLTGVRPAKVAHRLMDQGFAEDEIRDFLTRDYGLKASAADQLMSVAEYQRPFFLTGEEAGRCFSVYVGIPFCPTRCHYCSFPGFSLKQWGKYLPDYMRALRRELGVMGGELKALGVRIQTVYIGGGTPTVLDEAALGELMEDIRRALPLEADPEWTVEGGRTETLVRSKLRILIQGGANRLCINPQTMHARTLEAVGRPGGLESMAKAFGEARLCGFRRINSDLIMGLPGEGPEEIRQSLEQLADFCPENITLHALAIKRASAFKERAESISLRTDIFDGAGIFLKERGYRPYYLYRQKDILNQRENVGYTLAGSACLYNIQMMEERQTVLGFGVGASSKWVRPGERTLEYSYNPKDILVYLERLDDILRKKVDKLREIV
jgi:oxygen-independent coproporphyrinogen-3 oxidase